jgi:hypothetical protein
MEKKGREDERQVIKRQEKEWWVRYWGLRGRMRQREKGVRVGKGCGGEKNEER